MSKHYVEGVEGEDHAIKSKEPPSIHPSNERNHFSMAMILGNVIFCHVIKRKFSSFFTLIAWVFQARNVFTKKRFYSL